jgi:molybdate transport system substrate-binding protein
MQFVISGTVEAGFVAVSDLKKVERTLPSSFLMVDSQFYDPIDQQMVVIKNQKNIIEARALANFVTSKKGRAIIKSFGYDLPKQKLLK